MGLQPPKTMKIPRGSGAQASGTPAAGLLELLRPNLNFMNLHARSVRNLWSNVRASGVQRVLGRFFRAAAVIIKFSYMNDLRKRGLLAVPGISVCLLPKLACPACWPAYAGLLSSLGLGFLISTAYLLPLTAGFLVVALGTIALRARNRRGYGPFLIGLAAAGAILLAKFAWQSNPVMYSALGVLVMSSAWDAWTPKNANGEITHEKKTGKTKVEIFIAGCPLCERTIQLVMGLVGSSHQVVISDMRRPEVASRAEQYGIRTVPAVVIDGELTKCCKGRGCDEQVLRSALR